MDWKPFARLCGICGLSLAVVCGEEREHVHIELSTPIITAEPIVVQTSASPFTSMTLRLPPR